MDNKRQAMDNFLGATNQVSSLLKLFRNRTCFTHFAVGETPYYRSVALKDVTGDFFTGK